MASEKCGCFHCGAVFTPSEVKDWTDDWEGVGQTALCPRCGVDSVFGSESGYSTSEAFLAVMKTQWFSGSTHVSREETMAKYAVFIHWSEEDKAFIAQVPELPGCEADGVGYAAAVRNVQKLMKEWIETAKSLGRPIPELSPWRPRS